VKLSDFDYHLPPELIAQHPASPRDAARLMVVDRVHGTIAHRTFRDLPEFLTPADVLVLNDTRVLPVRLRARKPTGGAVEVLLLRRANRQDNEPGVELWETLIRPSRRVPIGTRIEVTDGVSGEVVDASPSGVRTMRFSTSRPLLEVARAVGEMPLPPYIHEPLNAADDYQTVYAEVEGAVAAPTAGLHFTPQLLAEIRRGGTRVLAITMHIGLGTFRPVRAERIEDHLMDQEWYEINSATAEALSTTRASARVVVVGTSAVRALETAAREDGTIEPRQGWSGLFIYPGYRFKTTRALVTNFHLPRTTLLMLVSAFAGRDLILRAYGEAVEERYRFYSFGDAMLIV
jgi:S-adenosylmethionine:tRNA ribosyltransferase-isomerase